MKVLVAGLGGIGQRHVRNLRAIMGAGVEILGCDPRRDIPVLTDRLEVEPGASIEAKHGVRVVPDVESALAAEPDAVFVCTPTSLHMAIAMQAARTGCALFIEKPLSHSFEQVDQLIGLVEERGLRAVVGYQLRLHPCLQKLHALVQGRAVGRILSVRAEVGEYLPGWHTYEDYRQSYAAREELGGGVILTQIHELDYLYWLFGMPARVFAVGGRLSGLEVDVEDTAEILMHCTIDGRPVPVSVHQDYLQRPAKRTCEVVGDAGRVVASLTESRVVVFDGNGRAIEASSFPEFQRNQMFLDELSLFLSGLPGATAGSRRAEEPPPGLPALVGVREAAGSLQIALAARASLATGRVIECAE
jgi:predicted dehydrogenase